MQNVTEQNNGTNYNKRNMLTLLYRGVNVFLLSFKSKYQKTCPRLLDTHDKMFCVFSNFRFFSDMFHILIAIGVLYRRGVITGEFKYTRTYWLEAFKSDYSSLSQAQHMFL